MSMFIGKGKGGKKILQLAERSLVRKRGFGKRGSSAPKCEGNKKQKKEIQC